MRACPQQRAQLHAENVRPGQRQADAAQAEERVAFAVDCHALHRLVAACIQCADDDRAAPRPIDEAAVKRVLRRFVRQGCALKQKLGARQADAVTDRGIKARNVGKVRDVEMHGNGRAIAGQGRAQRKFCGTRCGCVRRRLRRDKSGARWRGGFGHQQARIRLHQRLHAAGKARDRRAGDHRHAAPPRQNGHMAAGAAARQHQRAAARPVLLQKARGREICRHDNAAGRGGRCRSLAAQRSQHPVAQI